MSFFNLFFSSTKSLLLGVKCVSKHLNLQIFVIKLTNMSDFQPLEVVGRGSETQLQVAENLNKSGFRIRVSRWTEGWWKQQTVAEHRAYVINIG